MRLKTIAGGGRQQTHLAGDATAEGIQRSEDASAEGAARFPARSPRALQMLTEGGVLKYFPRDRHQRRGRKISYLSRTNKV